MNPLDARNKTLGEMMAELRVRLGFVAQGSASKNNDAVMKSFLQEGHDFLYSELEPPARRKKTRIRLQANSFLYDFHNDIEDEPINPGRVLSIWIVESDNIRRPLTQGITEAQRTLDDIRQAPERYDTLNGQIELWPIPGQEYDLVVEYIEDKPRFDRANDRPGVPDRLVFLYALAKAKAHYRHPDAGAQAGSLETMLRREKASQHENRRYFVGGAPLPSEKQVVRTANGGYQLKV